MIDLIFANRSNNTNKLSPQEQYHPIYSLMHRSNNTNKLSPQELIDGWLCQSGSSNNTNKLSPQELRTSTTCGFEVQIIQINLVLKNKQVACTSLVQFK